MKNKLLFFSLFCLAWLNGLAQSRQITGTVTGEGGTGGLPGVNVLVKGSSTGTITDSKGNYTLAVPGTGGTLVFSFIGYMTQEVPLDNRSVINITMAPDVKALSEVVVVGYGTVRKSDLTGSVTSISAEELKKVPIVSLDQGLQGRAAGVQVTQTSAAPGGGVSVRIRGGNSIKGGNEPLYVVDGFPIYNNGSSTGAEGAGRGGVSQNALSSINPNDIESIEVLKDASATAIYGSRGANGVVLITTKRGKAGDTRVNYEGYYGVQSVANKIDLLTGREFAEMVNEARINDKQPITFGGTDPRFPAPDQVANTDWQDEIFRNAPMQNHQLSFSGGGEKSQFALSGNYFDQEGVLVGSRFQRGSFRTNIDTKINERFKVGASVIFSRVVNNIGQSEGDGGGSAGAINAALVMAPTFPIRNDDGTYPNNDIPNGSTIGNPVATAFLTRDRQVSDRLLGNFFADYKIIEGLNFRVSVGTDLLNARRDIYHPKATIVGSGRGGLAAQSTNGITSVLNENILSYVKTFGVHSFNVTAGYTRQMEVRQFNRMQSTQFINDILLNDNMDAGQVPLPPSSGKNKWTLASWLGRVNYSLLDKYLFTFTARADGSSKFGAGNKWAFFPAAAVAWKAGEEPFIQNLNVFSELKLRTSYGITGNAELGLYQSLSRLGNQNYTFGNNTAIAGGIGPNSIANPDLKWETTATWDAGLDLGFFNNRLTATFDAYYKKTDDLLLDVTLPYTSGYETAVLNSGSIENRGIELSLGYTVFDGDFKWNLNGNIAANRNKILSLGDGQAFYAPQVSGHLKTKGSWVEVGQPVGVWREWVYDGVFQTQEQLDAGPRRAGDVVGNARYRDIDGDGDVDANDRVIVGNPNPDFIYGLTNNFSFKGFDLSIFIQGVQGNQIRNVIRQEIDQISPWGNQMRSAALRRWTPENPFTDVPRASRFNGAAEESSRQIEDGSFLRFRNVTLGYNLPSFRYFRNARVYVSGQNLITLTKYTGYDPEVSSQAGAGNQDRSNLNVGVDYNAYPVARTFLVGINLGF